MINRAKFFDGVRNGPFPGHLTPAQAAGISVILDAMDKFEQNQALPFSFRAYMLATMYHETAHTMQPIEEYGHGRGRVYGKPAGPWHVVYDGRGDVQLTWYDNYLYADKVLHDKGVLKPEDNLAKNPELAMRPDVAAAIMIYGMTEGWFTKRKLADYVLPSGRFDYVGARHIINGTDRAQLIAGYAQQFEQDLKAAA